MFYWYDVFVNFLLITIREIAFFDITRISSEVMESNVLVG
jgi:hypothetical protein